MWLDQATGAVVLVTSWLPAVRDVRQALEPLGFKRSRDGSYRLAIANGEDRLGVIRAATKALGVLLDEALGGAA